MPEGKRGRGPLGSARAQPWVYTDPALLLTHVKFLTPVLRRPAIKFSGIPQRPNPYGNKTKVYVIDNWSQTDGKMLGVQDYLKSNIVNYLLVSAT